MPRSAGVVIAAAFACALASVSLAAFQLSRFDRGVSILMLKQIKRDLEANYYDRTFHGIDIDAAFGAAEHRLRDAQTLSDALSIIAGVLGDLHDSHTIFFPPERVTRVRYGWRAGIVGGDAYVASVAAGSDAEAKGLSVGDRVLQWNGATPDRSNLRALTYVSRLVAPQVVSHLLIEKPDRTQRRLDVYAAVSARPPAQHADALVEDLAETLSPRAPDSSELVSGVLVWRLRSFERDDSFGRVLKRAADSNGLVLDLRGNGGGSIHAMEALVSRLFSGDVAIASVRTRHGMERLVAKGRRDAYRGRVAVLVDSETASAAEMAARVIQLEQRGAVIGDRTAGAVMTSRVFTHTAGIGSISFYADSITVGDVRMRDGASLEGVGVTPDATVLPNAADLSAGRDPALAHALTWTMRQASDARTR